MKTSKASIWCAWFDDQLRVRKAEAGREQEKRGALKRAQAEARSVAKAHFRKEFEPGCPIFLKGGQHPLLQHEAALLGYLHRAVKGSTDAEFFNFPVWQGNTKDGHFLMAFAAVGKPLTRGHFRDPDVLNTLLDILGILKKHGFAQGDLKPDCFLYYYKEGSAKRSVVMVDFDRGLNKTQVPPVEGPPDHYKSGTSAFHWRQFLATPCFGSLLQHLGFVSSPSTDLEQLGLMVIMANFPQAALWSGLKKESANAQDRIALIGKLKFLIMAQCGGYLRFWFRNRPTENPLQVLSEHVNPNFQDSEEAAWGSGAAGLFGSDDEEGAEDAHGAEGEEQEAEEVGRRLGEASVKDFVLPDECIKLLTSTLAFAMDQLTDEETAAYSAYERVLRNFIKSCLHPLPTSPEQDRQPGTGTGKSGTPVLAVKKKETESLGVRAFNALFGMQKASPEKPREHTRGSARGAEITPGKLVEGRVQVLLREGGLIEDVRDANGEHKLPVAPALCSVFRQKGSHSSSQGARGKEPTTEVDWLGRWGTASISAEGHLNTKMDGRIKLKPLVLSADGDDVSDWATDVELPLNGETRVLVEEGMGAKSTALRKVAQTDYKAAVLLHKEADTLNPLAFLKRDVMTISLVKSPTAGVVQEAMRELEKCGSTRHPYLQVLAWKGTAYMGIPYDLQIDQAGLTHSMEVTVSAQQVNQTEEVEKLRHTCAALQNQLTATMLVLGGVVVGLSIFALRLSKRT